MREGVVGWLKLSFKVKKSVKVSPSCNVLPTVVFHYFLLVPLLWRNHQ